ncbi:DUF2470 domain-containing protein [Microbacterium sp. JB110]|uniref:DUF2470 domain-containing protein n=1 Tax=Microbacterium sp. JB110 TaxID=2024477 RepID=UPI0020163A8C|nr:DUF2470 domain-containing protein [Microbacterium sp. JB110]
MNHDHRDDNALIARAFVDPSAESATMSGFDGDGGEWCAVTGDRSTVSARMSRPGGPITERPAVRREVVALSNASLTAPKTSLSPRPSTPRSQRRSRPRSTNTSPPAHKNSRTRRSPTASRSAKTKGRRSGSPSRSPPSHPSQPMSGVLVRLQLWSLGDSNS